MSTYIKMLEFRSNNICTGFGFFIIEDGKDPRTALDDEGDFSRYRTYEEAEDAAKKFFMEEYDPQRVHS